MSAPVTLPPSGRDFLVYHRVVVDSASTRAVAAEYEISQTRVRQIARRVGDWLEETLPAADENREAARLRVAQHIAADRLDRYLREADHAWRQTRETKYANLVLRVIAAQIRLPAMAGTLEALAMDAILGPLPEDVGQTFLSAEETKDCPTSKSRSPEPAEEIAVAAVQSMADKNVCPTSPPPVRDCSLESIATTWVPQQLSAAPTATPPAEKPCDNMPAASRSARAAFFATAQPVEQVSPKAEVMELRITPSQLGFSTNKPLSRRERRRKRRIAATK